MEFATWMYLFFLERAEGILSFLKARGIFKKLLLAVVQVTVLANGQA